MGIYTVYPGNGDAAGSLQETLLKEDVSDLITNLFPLDTPLQQALGTQAMTSVFTEYPVDTFSSIFRTAAVVGNGGVADPGALTNLGLLAKPEGYTYTASTPQYPAKLKAVVEIQGRRFQVSGTDRSVSMYGIGDRYNYEMVKVMKNVVNDFEHAFWWSKGTGPAGLDLDSGAEVFTMRQSQGLMWWILKSGLARSKMSGGLPGLCSTSACTDGVGNAFGSSSTLGTAAGSWAYDANGVSLDQAMFKERLMGPWWQLTNRGGAGAMGFASPRIKNLFSQFALSSNGPINERTIDAAAKRVVDTVDWYETDYGVVSITMSRYLSLTGQTITVRHDDTGAGDTTVACDECLVFIHPEYFKIGKLRGVSYSPLAKTGDFDDGQIVGEQGLLCTNPQGGAALVNCIA